MTRHKKIPRPGRDRARAIPERNPVRSQITTRLQELTALQEARYRAKAAQTQSPTYTVLADRAALLGGVLAGPAPAQAARSLSWETQDHAVAELLEDVAEILEEAA